MSQKVNPSTLAGFMELLPQEQILFNEMMETIKNSYEKFGFLPMITPNIERTEVLLAKGGGETEQQIYEVKRGSRDMALRFDLTVPLAKYVTMYFSDLTFPFRRYQIGKVYRGERNQRGRYREFFQCDVDIIGNGSIDIANDAEIPSVIYSTFKELGLKDFTIKINNRRILNGFFESLGIDDSTYVLRTIDKLDKMGLEKVKVELEEQEISEESIESIIKFIKIEGTEEEIIESLKKLGIENEEFNKGIEELELVVKYIEEFGVSKENYEIDLTIARGLDYYTGTVYETVLDNHLDIGSICSGGRYDDLASNFTNRKMPGVGISIGLTRLFYQFMEQGIIEEKKESMSKVLIIPMEGYLSEGIKTINKIREAGINGQVYMEKDRMGKIFGYADKLSIPYVIILGEKEVENEMYALRDMETGDQEDFTLEEVLEKLK